MVDPNIGDINALVGQYPGGGAAAPGAGSASDPLVRLGTTSRPAPTKVVNGQEFQHGMATSTSNTVARSTALLEPYKWSAARLKKEIAKAKSYGFDTGDDTLQTFVSKVWPTLVDSSIDFNTANPNKNVTPFDMYSLLGSKAAGKALAEKNAPEATGPKTTTTTNTSIDEIDAGAAHQVLSGALSQFLGRDASDDEVSDFLSRANALSAADPSKSVTTTTTNAAGDSQQSTSVTDPGFTSDDLQQAAIDQAQADPNYGETQAAMTIAPWLFSALQSPVG